MIAWTCLTFPIEIREVHPTIETQTCVDDTMSWHRLSFSPHRKLKLVYVQWCCPNSRNEIQKLPAVHLLHKGTQGTFNYLEGTQHRQEWFNNGFCRLDIRCLEISSCRKQENNSIKPEPQRLRLQSDHQGPIFPVKESERLTLSDVWSPNQALEFICSFQLNTGLDLLTKIFFFF